MLLSVALLIPAMGAPLAAQQRHEVGLQQPMGNDNTAAAREVQLLKQRADSLARVYSDGELSPAGRQRVGQELDRTVEELALALDAMNGEMMRAAGAGEMQMAPMTGAREAEAISRALTDGMGGGVAPRGWLGIVVTGAAREPWIERGELLIRYLTHPEVVSVEPGSPAERAGLLPGDTLIAYDGRDVRDTDLSLTRLLAPKARVTVRIKRAGRVRDVPVTIARAPSRIQLRRDDMNGATNSLRAPINAAPSFPRRETAKRGAPSPAPALGVTPTPMSAAAAGVAGAEMGSLTTDWARLTGVTHGVLVIRAPSGSLAAESGLRDADVIVKAGGVVVRTLPELREVIARAWSSGRRSLAIQYVRAKQTRSGTLRW